MSTGLMTWQHIADLAAHQDEQLGRTLELAARSPFYRRRWGDPSARRSVPTDRAGLAALPLTTKQDLLASYPFGMLAVPVDEVANYHESSGTGGAPTPSFFTEADWDDVDERFGRKWVGITAADVFLVRTPYAMMITGHMAHTGARRRGAMVVPGDNRSAAMPYPRVVRVLRDLRVTLTWSLPTETLLWAAAARAAGHEPGRSFPNLRALFVAGEAMSAARKRRIGEIWGCAAVEDYGSTETGPLAGECPRGSLHLWADRALFEVYDPRTGVIGRDGTGHLVVTPFGREAMPLVRYDLADDVEVSYRPCGCGWTLPTVRVFGRSAFGHRVAGTLVTQAALEELVFSLPARYGVMFWRARARAHELAVEVEVGARHRGDAVEQLRAIVAARFPVPLRVAGVEPGSLVPHRILTAGPDLVKPRSLFGPDEDWDRALLYY